MVRWALDLLSSRVEALRSRRRRQFVRALCSRGMRVGRDVVLMPGISFDGAYPWLIEIEDGCRISSNTRIMTHDATPFRDLGVTRLGRVRILRDSFVGEDVTILPGVTIGPRAMIAAGSVVGRDIGEGVLAAGNPARVYGQYQEYLERTREAAEASLVVRVADIGDPEWIARIQAALGKGEQVFVRDAHEDRPYAALYNATKEEFIRNAHDAFRRNFEDEKGARDGSEVPRGR